MKEWLERNKIYFETISTSLLAVMAIIVSIASIWISQNQLENDKLLNQPLIKVSNEVFSYAGGDNDSRFLIVENKGTPITEFSSRLYTFIKIEANKKPFEKSIDRQIIYIPINDYFGGTISTNNFKGELTTYIGINNYQLLNNIKTDFKKKFDKDLPMTFFSLIQFMEVGFKDYKGDKIAKLFKIDEVREGFEIERDEEFTSLLKVWKENSRSYIYTIKTEDIKELIIKNGS